MSERNKNTYDARMKSLNDNGVDTGKFFSIQIPKEIFEKGELTIKITDDNQVQIKTSIEHDEQNNIKLKTNGNIKEAILKNGYVKNTRLYRRFIMAQYMRLIDFANTYCDGNIDHTIKKFYNSKYMMKMILTESNVLRILEKKDPISFAERSSFFSKEAIVAIMEEYLDGLKQYAENPAYIKKCKGIPYAKIGGENIFICDLKKKLYKPIQNEIYNLKKAQNYAAIYRVLHEFWMHYYKDIRFDYFSKTWIDRFKAAGAYYTLKNMIMYHGIMLYQIENTSDKAKQITQEQSMQYLESKLREYKGYQYHALLKETIKISRFDFHKSIN